MAQLVQPRYNLVGVEKHVIANPQISIKVRIVVQGQGYSPLLVSALINLSPLDFIRSIWSIEDNIREDIAIQGSQVRDVIIKIRKVEQYYQENSMLASSSWLLLYSLLFMMESSFVCVSYSRVRIPKKVTP